MPDLSFDDLKSKQRAIRDGFEQDMGLRVHCAISWIGRAEKDTEDPDARFIFLWIAFNAAYADESDAGGRSFGTAREDFESFFARLIRFDVDHRIYNAIWTRFSGPIRLLMQNCCFSIRSGRTIMASPETRIGRPGLNIQPVSSVTPSRSPTRPPC